MERYEFAKRLLSKRGYQKLVRVKKRKSTNNEVLFYSHSIEIVVDKISLQNNLEQSLQQS